MSGVDLGVNTETIRSHASTVSDNASTLDTNVGVANATHGQVSGNAFGLICSFFAPPVNSQIENLTKMITDCAGAEKRLVNCLLQWAQEMDDLERKIKEDIKKAHEGQENPQPQPQPGPSPTPSRS